ncbi:MAG: type III-A CRISPR-associated protein Csm2 [Bacteroidota bacterium]
MNQLNNINFSTQFFNDMDYEELLAFRPPSNDRTGDAHNQQRIRNIIQGVEKLMQTLGKGITYTQLRNILPIVKNDAFKEDPSGLLLAIPKLAYLQGRPQRGEEGHALIQFIRELAWKVETKDQYLAFEEIVNAIVAYHKLYDKKQR